MVNHLCDSTGSDIMRTSETLVIKIGGENATRMGENFRVVEKMRGAAQRLALVISALRGGRNGGFNTTSALIGIAQALERHDVPGAFTMAQQIHEWTQHAVEQELRSDTSLTPEQSTQLIAILSRVIDGKIQTLQQHIHARAEGELHHLGEDWVLRNGTSFSITGWGEHLAQALYAAYFRARGIDCAAPPTEVTTQGLYGDRPSEELASRAVYHQRIAILQRQMRRQIERSTGRIIVLPGYLFPLGISRGYSDTAGACIALAAAHRDRVVYLVLKNAPVMSEDPLTAAGQRSAEVVQRLTYPQAMAIMVPGGRAAGVVHPDALSMLAQSGIPTVVCPPAEIFHPEGRTLIV